MAEIVVVFDFDKTIIECDSDNWVVDELGFTDLFNQLLPTMPWNSLMDKMMKEIHEQGKSIEDIVNVLKRIPIHPKVIKAIKSAYSLGCDLKIVSDANEFFIETVLEHLKLRHCFSEIVTNPSFVDQQGKLRIFPFRDLNDSDCSHGCTGLCPPNMCKGVVLERIQASIGNKRLIYLGDGIGDYCPGLKLKNGDFFMPRRDFPVWDLICKNPSHIVAEIHSWNDGAELMKTLLNLIDTILLVENSLSFPTNHSSKNNSVVTAFASCGQFSQRPRLHISDQEIWKSNLRVQNPSLIGFPARNKFIKPIVVFHGYACLR